MAINPILSGLLFALETVTLLVPQGFSFASCTGLAGTFPSDSGCFSESVCVPAMKQLVVALIVCCGSMASGQQSIGPSAGSGPAPEYRLTAGDTIDVRFFFNSELNDVVQIRPDGGISVQLVGEVNLAGKSVPEAVKIIETAAAPHVRSPRVSIQVRGYAGQKIFVTGEVVRPGVVGLPGELTVLEAIGEAGGVLPTGNKKKTVLIRRGPDGNPIRTELTLMVGNKPTAHAQLRLHPFDVLLVPETAITKIDRWVDQYIRQLSPIQLTAGFTYVYSQSSQVVLPF